MDKNSTPYTLGFAATITIICAVLLGVAATKLKPLQQKNAEVDKKSKILLAVGEFDPAKPIKGEEVLKFFSEKGNGGKFVVKFAVNSEGEVLKDINKEVLKSLELEPQMKEHPDVLKFGPLQKALEEYPESRGKSLDELKAMYPKADKSLLEDLVKQFEMEEKRKYPIFAFYSSEENFKAEKADKYIIPIYGYGLWSNCYGVLALNEKGDTVENIVYYKHGETPGLGGEIEKDYFTKPFQGKKVFNEKGDVALTTTKGVINENTVPAVSGATFTMDGVNNMLKKFITIYDKFFQKKRGGAQ